MELHYLKLFNTLASEHSFSKTADALFISQPAVSMQIKKLETDLGLKLFDKIGRKIYLNENGKLLYEYTKKIFELVDEARSQLNHCSGTVNGIVNIGASNTPGTYILPAILGDYMEMHPMVECKLHIANTYEIEHMILDNQVDFAINGGNIPYCGRISVEKLSEDDIIFVTAPGGKLSECDVITRKDLIDCRFVTHERNSMLYKQLEYILKELELPVNITMTLGSIDAIKQAVSAGLGLSAIPRSAVRTELKYKLLKPLKIKDREWMYPYNLIYYKGKYISPAVNTLMELVKLHMGKLKDGPDSD